MFGQDAVQRSRGNCLRAQRVSAAPMLFRVTLIECGQAGTWDNVKYLARLCRRHSAAQIHIPCALINEPREEFYVRLDVDIPLLRQNPKILMVYDAEVV